MLFHFQIVAVLSLLHGLFAQREILLFDDEGNGKKTLQLFFSLLTLCMMMTVIHISKCINRRFS